MLLEIGKQLFGGGRIVHAVEHATVKQSARALTYGVKVVDQPRLTGLRASCGAAQVDGVPDRIANRRGALCCRLEAIDRAQHGGSQLRAVGIEILLEFSMDTIESR